MPEILRTCARVVSSIHLCIHAHTKHSLMEFIPSTLSYVYCVLPQFHLPLVLSHPFLLQQTLLRFIVLVHPGCHVFFYVWLFLFAFNKWYSNFFFLLAKYNFISFVILVIWYTVWYTLSFLRPYIMPASILNRRLDDQISTFYANFLFINFTSFFASFLLFFGVYGMSYFLIP